MILGGKGIILKLTGTEVYYTTCSLLILSKNSCGELDCQKGLNLIHSLYKIGWLVAGKGWVARAPLPIPRARMAATEAGGERQTHRQIYIYIYIYIYI